MNADDHMELSPYDRWPGKRGQPLTELLVVMLIFTILSVAMLPCLRPYIAQAQYIAEASPTVGYICTRIELFRFWTKAI